VKEERVRLVQRLWSQFAGLPPAHPAILSLALASQARRLERDEVLVVEGAEDGTVYLVGSGLLRTVRSTPQGHDIWYADLGPGDITGDMAALTGSPRTSSVVARSASTVFAIDRDAFLAVAGACPEFTLSIARMLARRLHATSNDLAELASLPVSSRLHGELAAMGVAVPGDSEAFDIVPPPSVRALALRIHATREATSRAVGVLERRGVLTRSRGRWRVILPDEGAADPPLRNGPRPGGAAGAGLLRGANGEAATPDSL